MRPLQDLDALREAGRRRLYPRINDPNWLVLRRRRQIFRNWLSNLPVPDPVVLDIGGRIQPYRELIPTPCRYYAIDLQSGPLLTAVARAEQLPFRSESVYLVLCTQMIEYAANPFAVADEIRRVLRPGGILVLSAPSIFPRDSPHDRWRFFAAGLKQLLAGFSRVEIVPESGNLAGVLRTAAITLHAMARFDLLRRLLRFSAVPIINLVGSLEPAPKDSSFTVNYSVRAVK
jgi:SAM-dependent methyltransferase